LPLKTSKNTFAKAYKDSGVRKIERQSTHILRHSFASHFMMNGGNILTLQKILGYSTVNVTMRYAHLSPDHLQEALEFAPVVKLWLN
jgi:site-specific recombinase XerD